MGAKRGTVRLIAKTMGYILVGLLFSTAGYFYGKWTESIPIEEKLKATQQELTATQQEEYQLRRGNLVEKINTFIEVTEYRLILYSPPKDFAKVQAENLEELANEIVRHTAMPIVQNGYFVGVASFDKEVKTGAKLFIVHDLHPQEYEDYRNLVKGLLRPGDRILEIGWVVIEGGGFKTLAILGEDGDLKFEPMLYFTPRTPETRRSVERRVTETTIVWDGDIKNYLNIVVITWEGKVTFKADGTHILAKPYADLNPQARQLLWHVTSKSIVYSDKIEIPLRPPLEVQDVKFAFEWWSGVSEVEIERAGWGAIQVKNLGVTGSGLERTIELRGDGSAWSHGEYISIE